MNKNHIKVLESWKQENGMYKCPHCDKEYVKKGISTHIWRTHGNGKNWIMTNINVSQALKQNRKNCINDDIYNISVF